MSPLYAVLYPRCTFRGRLDRSQKQSGHHAPAGTEPPFLDRPTRNTVTTLTELSPLPP
jgi:hypothetical protein